MRYDLPNNSVVAVHDIFDPLPEFMLRADTVFVDIPFNQSLLTNYLNRDAISISEQNTGQFADFINRLFDCVQDIHPLFLFIETGKEALADCIIHARSLYRYVTFYNATYYGRPENKSYIVHGTNQYRQRRYRELEDLDEVDAIKWICHHHTYECIGDLCMGQGLIGLSAYQAGKPFVGTELNERRLAVLLQKLAKAGAVPIRVS